MVGERIIIEETMVNAGINFLCRSVPKTTIVIAEDKLCTPKKNETKNCPLVCEIDGCREMLFGVDYQSGKECVFIVAGRRRNAICEIDSLERHGIRSVLKRYCILNSLKKYAMY